MALKEGHLAFYNIDMKHVMEPGYSRPWPATAHRIRTCRKSCYV